MKIGLIAAMDIELQAFIDYGEAVRTEKKFGREIHQVKIGEHEVFMAVSGVGKVNAASLGQMLLDFYQVELLINTGIAGSIDKNLKILDVVLATELVYHDFPAWIMLDHFPFMVAYKTDEDLRGKMREAIPEDVKVMEGIIASGDDFIDSEEKKQRIYDLTGAVACDMESAAVAQIAVSAEIPCLILRTISDDADESYTGKYEQFKNEAAAISSKAVIRFLESKI